MREEVILVDDLDNPIGEMEKIEAHQKGLLHRAFSIFLFNTEGEILLQQRAKHKYHTPGLWTNTCCSHPRSKETTLDAANRRLAEEMGLSASLEHLYTFKYKAQFSNGLTEHEMDHVFVGLCDAKPNLNPDEVHSFRYWKVDQLLEAIKTEPESYTPWFKLSFPEVMSRIQAKMESLPLIKN